MIGAADAAIVALLAQGLASPAGDRVGEAIPAAMVWDAVDTATPTSVEAFRAIFKPQLARLVEVAHRHGVAYMQHSCGAIRPLIEEFIDISADLLNPIQTMADGMDMASVQRDYGSRIALYGGIDTQHLLPNGPVEEIRRTVADAVASADPWGGFILSGSQGLMDDIPYAHAAAMLDPALRA